MANKGILAINDILSDYSRDIQEGITNAAIEVAEQGKNELKATSPRKTGSYSKGWRVDKRQGKGFVHTTIYNATNWQLTHLLEKEHVIRNQYGTWGTYSPTKSGTKHIEPVEQKCIKQFERDVEQIIKNGE